MGEVVCTIHFSESEERDLVLPDNIQVHLLVDSIVKALSLPTEYGQLYDLFQMEGGQSIRIPGSRTLQQSYISNGSEFYILPDDGYQDPPAFLINRSGQKFLLRQNNIIGRYTLEKHVDIDLSALDNNKVISRRHAVITRIMQNYFIKDAGSRNGTYINSQPIPGGQSITLQPGDEVCFGSLTKGVKLRFEVDV